MQAYKHLCSRCPCTTQPPYAPQRVTYKLTFIQQQVANIFSKAQTCKSSKRCVDFFVQDINKVTLKKSGKIHVDDIRERMQCSHILPYQAIPEGITRKNPTAYVRQIAHCKEPLLNKDTGQLLSVALIVPTSVPVSTLSS